MEREGERGKQEAEEDRAKLRGVVRGRVPRPWKELASEPRPASLDVAVLLTVSLTTPPQGAVRCQALPQAASN